MMHVLLGRFGFNFPPKFLKGVLMGPVVSIVTTMYIYKARAEE